MYGDANDCHTFLLIGTLLPYSLLKERGVSHRYVRITASALPHFLLVPEVTFGARRLPVHEESHRPSLLGVNWQHSFYFSFLLYWC
jgi:hypothetical protein